ncbi:MAG: hypothetical protein LBE74_04955 [Treponema sp.]|jgi:hypothetical protein|nr:hypothetical protein [Treponema sp.]
MKEKIIAGVFCFAALCGYALNISIPVKNDFSLDPVIGITGEESDSDSRFVQRMIFSPLVMPTTDPLIDPNFSYDISVSMIDKGEYFSEKSKQFAEIYNLQAPFEDPTRIYRAQLRDDMSFKCGDSKYNGKVTAEDVVFSYRVAQTTLSIKTRQGAYDNYTNAILRAQLADMEQIKYINERTIEFVFKTPRNTKDFINFLVYTPILSVNQLRGAKEQERNSYIFGKTGDSKDYDIRQYKTVYDFETLPASYGQFYVSDKIVYSSNKKGAPLKTGAVKLRRNRDWNLNKDYAKDGRSSKAIETWETIHKDYQNDSSIVVSKTNQSILVTNVVGTSTLLVNYPLTVNDYMSNVNFFNMSGNYRKIAVEQMFISYKLYGLLYSSSAQNKYLFDTTEVRTFFRECLNRSALMESLKVDPAILENRPAAYKELIEDKVEIVPLYYPFFAGKEPEASSQDKLDRLYRELREKDVSYQSDINLSKDIKNFETLTGDRQARQAAIRGYLAGELPEAMLKHLAQKLPSQIKEGVWNVRILYDDNDKIAKLICDRYVININKVGQYLERHGFKTRIKAEPVILSKTKKGRISDVDKKAFDIAVYGWNYRFDFLGEFMSFLDKNAGGFISSDLYADYDEFLKEIGKKSVPDRMFEIADKIVRSEIISTLFAVKNYLLYDKEKAEVPTLKDLGPPAIMYPYYWGK